MSKREIIDWSLRGLAALTIGFILLLPAVLTLAARQPQNGVADTYGRTMLALIISGGVFALAGVAVELLVWGAAVRHASALADSRWRTVLLWGGVAGIITVPLLGVGVLIFGSVLTAYLVAAPNRPSAHPQATTPTKPLIVRRADRGWAVTAAGVLSALAVPYLLTNPGRPLHGLLWPSLVLVAIGFAVAGIGAVMVGAAWGFPVQHLRSLRQDMVPQAPLDRDRRRRHHAAVRARCADLVCRVRRLRAAGSGRHHVLRPPSGINALPGLMRRHIGWFRRGQHHRRPQGATRQGATTSFRPTVVFSMDAGCVAGRVSAAEPLGQEGEHPVESDAGGVPGLIHELDGQNGVGVLRDAVWIAGG